MGNGKVLRSNSVQMNKHRNFNAALVEGGGKSMDGVDAEFFLSRQNNKHVKIESR